MSKGRATRERMIGVAAEAIEEMGPAATGINEVLRRAGAPRGSLYFHFPGGKDELVAEAVRFGAGRITELAVTAADEGGSAADVIGRLIKALADRQEESGFTKGCPVAGTALDAPAGSELAGLCAEIYDGWEATLRGLITAEGRPEALAGQILALVEGALLLSRVRATRAPLDAATVTVRTLLEAA
ncbi:TetR/AcrR family transcriptional regulator [Actinocorallia sp. API 0066]|uniref:TetR/AcrR family transcriptional regulator n=1 Tax=Actinocorallia sp. API 0066 TaxID=2896846 RepID=UPI001E650DF5|nr:TetR/AcrR family transcriptional regulator [Actinocorallia sp. API 0066]MCD0450501.1 TetR/AcrR family transcriptional regulator [Actinocorallia sp. API 0066]